MILKRRTRQLRKKVILTYKVIHADLRKPFLDDRPNCPIEIRCHCKSFEINIVFAISIEIFVLFGLKPTLLDFFSV